jgi:hypothetical protein
MFWFAAQAESLNNIWTSFGYKGLNSINKLIFLMEKCCVFSEVESNILNII